MIDRGIIESLGPRGLYALLTVISKSFSVFQQSGNFYRLALSILGGLVVIIPCFFFVPNIIYYILFISLMFLKTE